VTLADGLEQQRVMQKMLDGGVATRRGVMCAHLESSYPADTWRAGSSLETSERNQRQGLMLPLFHELTADQQRDVVALLRAACDGRES
jgi:dTDP-4-amino-4,6-dideoxygalactose transaminase